MNIVKLSERIARIDAEVGDKADERLTAFELGFLANLKRLRFGSDGQRIVLERIEKKVLGQPASTTGISDTSTKGTSATN